MRRGHVSGCASARRRNRVLWCGEPGQHALLSQWLALVFRVENVRRISAAGPAVISFTGSGKFSLARITPARSSATTAFNARSGVSRSPPRYGAGQRAKLVSLLRELPHRKPNGPGEATIQTSEAIAGRAAPRGGGRDRTRAAQSRQQASAKAHCLHSQGNCRTETEPARARAR